MKKILSVLLFLSVLIAQKLPEFINSEIKKGNFTRASYLIDSLIIFGKVTDLEKWYFNFEKDKLQRIRLDFTKNLNDLMPYIKNYYPNISVDEIRKYEEDNSLECMIIDGEKKYFYNADKNLFRINSKLREIKNNIEQPKLTGYQETTYKEIPELITKFKDKRERFFNPVNITYKYRVTLKPNVIPDGEIVRAWLPFPKENSRQRNIKLLSANDSVYIISDNTKMHRTIYFEKRTKKDEPTIFEYFVSYESYAEVNLIDENNIVDKDYAKIEELKPYLTEFPPHIVFTDKIKELSNKIVGNEKNKFRIMKKIYDWIDDNIPWASAKEYSTIENIPEYVVDNKHGDCGQVSLLFITLCRLNGIPAKWQSGWMFHPSEINLHDWAEVYFEPYGWIPIDQSFGKHNFENYDEKYFFLGSTDNYHFIVNDNISQDFFPFKIYPRSETVDFQRGELEWRGGNIYFNNWQYEMEVSYNK